MSTFTYENVSKEQAQNVLSEIQTSGARVTGAYPQWSVSGQGIEASANITIGGVLTVQVTKKPFFVPDAAIDGQIKKALGRS